MGVFLLSFPPLSEEKSNVFQCCKISDLYVVILRIFLLLFLVVLKLVHVLL